MDTARLSTIVLSIFFLSLCQRAVSDTAGGPPSMPTHVPEEAIDGASQTDEIVTRQTNPELFGSIATAPERTVGDNLVIQYDTGIWLDINEPLGARKTARLRNGSASVQLQIVIDLVATHVTNSSRFQLIEGLSIGETEEGDWGTALHVFQIVDSHQLSALRVQIPAGDTATLNISGILVDPSLPQLDQKLWIEESSALALANDELEQQYAVDTEATEGTLTIEVDRSDEMTIQPIYTVAMGGAIAKVNLYTQQVTSFRIAVY